MTACPGIAPGSIPSARQIQPGGPKDDRDHKRRPGLGEGTETLRSKWVTPAEWAIVSGAASSRTYPAWAAKTSPVLKPQRAGCPSQHASPKPSVAGVAGR